MGFFVLRRVLQKGAGIFRCGRISQKGAGGCCPNSSTGGRRMMSSVRMSPWLMLSPSFDDDSRSVVYKFHSVGSKGELICESKSNSINLNELEFAGSSHGWLALYNWRNDDVFLSNPISGRLIKLPPLHTLPDPEVNSRSGVSRVALSCSPDREGCRVMMTVGRARRLAFCVPGRSKEWTPIGDLYCERWNYFTLRTETASREYEDVVYSSRHKLFFCITRVGTELEGWNVGDPMSPTIDWRVPHNGELNFDRRDYPWPSLSEKESEYWHLKYLVFAEQSDELFLVVRHVNPRMCRYSSLFMERIYYSKYRGCDYSYPYKTINFDVYKIDLGGKLRHMKDSLEGLAMFIGINHSYAVSASEFPELNPNSIYFGDENRLIRLGRSDVHNEYGGHDNGIFDYQNKTFTSCCGNCPWDPPLHYQHITRIHPPPLWFTPEPISHKS